MRQVNQKSSIGYSSNIVDFAETGGGIESLVICPKKKTRNEKCWKRNVAKTLMNSGQCYTNVKGVNAPAKKFLYDENHTCRLHCNAVISQSELQDIFESVWDIEIHTEQNMYISAMVEQIPVKRRVTTADISDEEAIISEEGVVMNEDNEEPSFLIIDRYPRKRNRISRGCWFTFRLYIMSSTQILLQMQHQ